MGQAATAIKVEPVGKNPTPRDLAALGKGVNIREVSPQADGSGVRVVTPDARRVREQLQQRYGKALIVTEGP